MFHRDNRLLCSTVPKFTQHGDKIGRGHLLQESCPETQDGSTSKPQAMLGGTGSRNHGITEWVRSPSSMSLLKQDLPELELWVYGGARAWVPNADPSCSHLAALMCRICHHLAAMTAAANGQLCCGVAVPQDFCTTVGPVHEDSLGIFPSGICRPQEEAQIGFR